MMKQKELNFEDIETLLREKISKLHDSYFPFSLISFEDGLSEEEKQKSTRRLLEEDEFKRIIGNYRKTIISDYVQHKIESEKKQKEIVRTDEEKNNIYTDDRFYALINRIYKKFSSLGYYDIKLKIDAKSIMYFYSLSERPQKCFDNSKPLFKAKEHEYTNVIANKIDYSKWIFYEHIIESDCEALNALKKKNEAKLLNRLFK